MPRTKSTAKPKRDRADTETVARKKWWDNLDFGEKQEAARAGKFIFRRHCTLEELYALHRAGRL